MASGQADANDKRDAPLSGITRMTPANLPASIRARLRNLAERERVDFGAILTRADTCDIPGPARRHGTADPSGLSQSNSHRRETRSHSPTRANQLQTQGLLRLVDSAQFHRH